MAAHLVKRPWRKNWNRQVRITFQEIRGTFAEVATLRTASLVFGFGVDGLMRCGA
jgi:hypothetical protein